MSRFLLVIIPSLFSFILSAQDKKKFTINPGERLVDKIPAEEIYRYSRFELADISFKDGTMLRSWLNYNSLFGEMQFIDPNDDTLSIAEEKNIRWIAVEKDSFYFSEGWLEQVTNNNIVKLVRKKKIALSNKEQIGGMDVPGFGSIETYTKYTGSQSMKDLVAKEKLTYTVFNTYYFGDRFNHFFPANKKSLLKIYGKQQKIIEQYLEENKIDFTSENELIGLLTYLQDK